jgi:hypothetical protein
MGLAMELRNTPRDDNRSKVYPILGKDGRWHHGFQIDGRMYLNTAPIRNLAGNPATGQDPIRF